MIPEACREEFVTVLKVNNQMDCSPISPFVTVVELGSSNKEPMAVEASVVEEEIIMYRLPGERLGMGLKFEGGIQATECVSHVFIQSVAADSPSARTETSWGGLTEGDEILKVDGRSVREMTRVDCVTILKKAPVAIKLLILHGSPAFHNRGGSAASNSAKLLPMNGSGAQSSPAGSVAQQSEIVSPPQSNSGQCFEGQTTSHHGKLPPEMPLAPPPIPPRKVRVRKESASLSSSNPSNPLEPQSPPPPPPPPLPPPLNGDLKPTISSDAEENLKSVPAQDSCAFNRNGGGVSGVTLPGWEELMLRRLSTTSSTADSDVIASFLPVAPDAYVDLTAEEDKRSLLNEYESDDTGSSASTVIERLTSAVGSVHSLVTEPSSNLALVKNFPNTEAKPTMDLSKVLSPFEQLEKEIEFDLLLNPSGGTYAKSKNWAPANLTCAVAPGMASEMAGEDRVIEPPERFKDYCHEERRKAESATSAPPSTGKQMTSLKSNNDEQDDKDSSVAEHQSPQKPCRLVQNGAQPETGLPVKRHLSPPPPIPPRKLKLGKRNSLDSVSSASATQLPSNPDDDFEDSISSMTFPIIGNLLQELEQLPEFSRPHARNPGNPACSIPTAGWCSSSRESCFQEETDCDPEPVDVNDSSLSPPFTGGSTPVTNPDSELVPSTSLDQLQLDGSDCMVDAEISTRSELNSGISELLLGAQPLKITNEAENYRRTNIDIDSEQVQLLYGEEASHASRAVDVAGGGAAAAGGDLSGEHQQQEDEEEEEEEEEDQSSSTCNTICEVVAVIEKPSVGTELSQAQHALIRPEESAEKATMANTGLPLSTGSSLDFAEVSFMPAAFSRLPPDGHEFPPNYSEPEASVDDPNRSDKSDLMQFDPKSSSHPTHFIQPPVGFEDGQSRVFYQRKVSPPEVRNSPCKSGGMMFLPPPPPPLLDTNISGSLDDVRTLSSTSSDAGDTVVFDELPPPPPLIDISETSSCDGDHSRDPSMEGESHDDDVIAPPDLGSPWGGVNGQNQPPWPSSTSPPMCKTSPPAVPPKRKSPQIPDLLSLSRTSEEKSMSVRDKIAMFSMSESSSTSSSQRNSAQPKLRPSSRSICSKDTRTLLKESAEYLKTEVVSNNSPSESSDSSVPIQVDVRETQIQVHAEIVHSSHPSSNASDYSLDGRPGSSLSISSYFSKSSDDLLSQDVDSSDVDDSTVAHIQHQSLDHRRSVCVSTNLQRYGYDSKVSSSNKNTWSTSSTDSDITTSAEATRPKSALMVGGCSSKKSMYAILESRKQNVSKLKGLVIPQLQETQPQPSPLASAQELPLIFSVDSILLSKVELAKEKLAAPSCVSDSNKSSSNGSPLDLLSKTSLSDLPKYSPAFKRKPFSLSDVSNGLEGHRGATGPYGKNQMNGTTTKNQQPLPDVTLTDPLSSGRHDGNVTSVVNLPDTDACFASAAFIPPPLPKSMPPSVAQSKMNGEGDLSTCDSNDRLAGQDTEDQESGISSIESPNVSIHNTPPGSPKDIRHASQFYSANNVDGMTESSPTPGIQQLRKISLPAKSSPASVWEEESPASSADSSDLPIQSRILKAKSVEAINRMNVLNSSRNSCGGKRLSGDNMDDVCVIQLDKELPQEAAGRSATINTIPEMTEGGDGGGVHHRRQVSLDGKISPGRYSKDSLSPEKERSSQMQSSNRNAAELLHRRSVSTTNLESPPKAVSDERWLELERKYGSKNTSETDGSLRRASPSSEPQKPIPRSKGTASSPSENGHNGFRALADKWEQRSTDGSQPSCMKASASLSKSLSSILQNGPAKTSTGSVDGVNTVSGSSDVSPSSAATSGKLSPSFRQPSVSPSAVAARDKKSPVATGSSRPTSLIETDAGKSKLWPEITLMSNKVASPKPSPVAVNDQLCHNRTVIAAATAFVSSSSSSSSSPSSSSSSSTAKPRFQDIVNGKSRRSTSFNDLRQIFENQEMSMPSAGRKGTIADNRHGPKESSNHIRMSSLDSTASESEPGTPAHYGSATSLGSAAVDHYGSITSLASSTSLISPQELQQLIDEANHSLEESGTPSHEITVVVLQREIPGGSIGITLAGGADYDSKEITVNKVISGSLADRDGRIQKGDRVLSINGKNLKGVTHREALCILKAPRTDCVLVLSRSRSSSPNDAKENGNFISRTSNSNHHHHHHHHRARGVKLVSGISVNGTVTNNSAADMQSTPALIGNSTVITTQIIKDIGGLGFSLDGGKDSPIGDKPLTIKKIFAGGAADKNGVLRVGDEILSVNSTDVTKMARIEAWNFMRKLPDGVVTMVINHGK